MTTALYRRYRPETFDEVIGQDHVTEPLKAALRSNRVTHAYLFSGPRGCGKTTSARILARCLNCAEGPTDTPCGKCESCRELATGGPGSLDVVEIDAASHNGVDDARELRERATFAPVRDRYKVFILDEAHMVTPQGFNALLKLVEEPPEHVKFVFATTEPERVIGTIRSRTHHYPFRLVPSDVMTPFLADMCEHESVKVGEGVLPLVVRAGGGSVRDSLSVLDQLMAGSIDSEISYDRAVALLGYTDSGLLDDAVNALADHNGAAIFGTIERMVESGHDPRRFVEDFLQRLRDLLIISVAGEDARDILAEMPAEQRDHMFQQATKWGPRALSTAADLTEEALRTMVGATSPRLQLELLVGRILVELAQPAAPAISPGAGYAAQGAPAGGYAGQAGPGSAQGYAGSQAPAGMGTGPGAIADNGPAIVGPDGQPLRGAALARAELERAQQQVASAKPQSTTEAAPQQREPENAEPQSRQTQSREPQKPQEPEGSGHNSPAPEPQERAEKFPEPRDRAPQAPEPQAPQQREATEAQSRPAEPTPSEPSREHSEPDRQPRQSGRPEQSAKQRPQESEKAEKHESGRANVGNVTSNLHGKWDQFIEAVRAIMPSSAMLIGTHATLISEDADSVTFGFQNQNFVGIFMNRHRGPAAKAIEAVTGVAKTPLAVVGNGPQSAPERQPEPEPQAYHAGPEREAEPEPQPRAYRPGFERAAEPKPEPNPQAYHAGPDAARDSEPQPQPYHPGPPEQNSAASSNTEVAGEPDDDQYAPEHATPNAATKPENQEAREELAQNVAESTPARGFTTIDGGVQPEARQPEEPEEPVEETPIPPRPTSHLRTFEGGAQAQRQAHPQHPQAHLEPEPETEPDDDYYDPTGGARPDDLGADQTNLIGLPLVQKMFGAKIIEQSDEGGN